MGEGDTLVQTAEYLSPMVGWRVTFLIKYVTIVSRIFPHFLKLLHHFCIEGKKGMHKAYTNTKNA